ncbi:MAG: hypothetical protein RIS64_3566 [Bacteroidota bacterium]|jgi:hypothetical protein
MEDWEFEFEWLKVRHTVKEAFQQDGLPDLNLVLLLIGIQELGRWQKRFSKEEKQDLMHIAVCTLLSDDGYYEFVGRDTEGWPHFNAIRVLEIKGEKAQEHFLKTKIIVYFKNNQDVNQ